MNRTCDVAIIGGGPAGSTLAALLAMRGFDAVVLERDEFPRDKVCGEFLSHDAMPILERLGLAEEIDRTAALIPSCRLVAGNRSFEFDLPAPARGISRGLFDTILAERARAAGADVIEGAKAETLERSGRGWRVTATLRDGSSLAVDTKLVAGAWGRWGRFDRQLGRRFVADRSKRSFGFKRHFRGAGAGAHIELYSFRSGYLGASPIEQGETNICGLVDQRRISGLRGGWEAFVESLRAESGALASLFDAHEPLGDGFLSSDPVILRAKEPVVDGIVMVGDAAGVIDPLAGNGMTMAVQSAVLAAEALAARLESAREADAAYANAFSAFFSRRIRWSRVAAYPLSHPRLLGILIAVAGWPAAGRKLAALTRASLEDAEKLAARIGGQ
jgi:menaquinone-9 beta-reductase